MFVYWVLFPVLLGLTLAGLGLGVRRIGVAFGASLVLPVGYCTAVVISAIPTWTGETTNFTVPILLVLAIAGWLTSLGDVRAALRAGGLRRHLPWVLAGLAGFLVFGASVLASGTPTFTGYNQIVDIAMQMNFASYLADHGRDPILQGSSTYLSAVNSTLHTGYPAGPQAVLGTFPKFFGMELAWAWQPYLAMVAGLMVLSGYSLLRLVTDSRTFAAVGAFAAGQASTLIGYGQIGGIKELTAAATILAAGALIPTTLTPGRPSWRAALPFALGLAAAYSVFSLTVLPWLGILGLGAVALVWSSLGRAEALRRGGFAIAFLVIVTLPTSIPAKDSGSFAHLMEKEMGNLADPVSRWAISGTWFTDDHRFALHGSALTVSVIVSVIVILLALLGLFTAWRRKQPTLIILWVASVLGWLVLVVRLGPWVEFKGLAVASPVMLLLAFVGLSGLREAGRKPVVWVGVVGAAGLLFAGLVSDALRYGSAQLAPYQREQELRSYGERFAGTKAAITPDWDEHAGYQVHKANIVQSFNWPFKPTAEFAAQNDPSSFGYGRQAWDLDELDPAFINSFDLIIQRRSPEQSRPSREFVKVAQGRFFVVWQKSGATPATQHLALSGKWSPGGEQQQCQDFVAAIPKDQTVTLAGGAPLVAETQFDDKHLAKGWTLGEPTIINLNGYSGTTSGTADVGAFAGPFDVFAQGQGQRKVTVTIEGKTFTVERDPSAAVRGQYLGTLDLANGKHEVDVKVGGSSLLPGTSNKANKLSWVGHIQLIPKDQIWPTIQTAAATQIQCPGAVDWVETP